MSVIDLCMGWGATQYVDDVFSTYLYTGNGSTQDIENGIDLAGGKGGMVWIKNRDATDTHVITDTERGAGETLTSETTAAEVTNADTTTAFNSDGFNIGADVLVNTSSENYASWTFRKAPRFFDIVKYTGNGVAGREIAHDLGVAPGMIIVKRLDSESQWRCYHTSLGATKGIDLNQVAVAYTYSGLWNNTEPTDSVFTLGAEVEINSSGNEYIAYLFAHDPLGPSGDGSDGLIACGSYVGNGLADGSNKISLGWEPQYVMIKKTSEAANWNIYDSIRGVITNSGSLTDDYYLFPNLSNAEDTQSRIAFNADGFELESANTEVNQSTHTYIYMAIRRPNKPPTSGTEVFAIDNGKNDSVLPTYISDFVVDLAIDSDIGNALGHNILQTRLTGINTLYTDGADFAADVAAVTFDFMNGWRKTTSRGVDFYSWMFRRAPGFFDVVCYTGTGSAMTVAHNLGAVPELMIVKCRNHASGYDWRVFHSGIDVDDDGRPETDGLNLNETWAAFDLVGLWNDVAPTATNFTVGTNDGVNINTYKFIAYLFATLAGISKVGSYTGNGTSQTIDCGFAAGARFVLIKRTDSTGDWYIWDSVRGIVAGNDPHLSLNTTAAEVTTDDSVDPAASGFIVNQVTATNINVTSADYIFLAIA